MAAITRFCVSRVSAFKSSVRFLDLAFPCRTLSTWHRENLGAAPADAEFADAGAASVPPTSAGSSCRISARERGAHVSVRGERAAATGDSGPPEEGVVDIVNEQRERGEGRQRR